MLASKRLHFTEVSMSSEESCEQLEVAPVRKKTELSVLNLEAVRGSICIG